MNKVVKHEHIAAAALPEALRGGIPADAMVTVTIQEEGPTGAADMNPMDILESVRRARRKEGRSLEEAVGEIRAMRDEWDV